MADDSDYPTILIVYKDKEFRDVLISKLEPKGYFILEANDAAAALEIVIHHSRRIQLLLTDDNDDSRTMAARLKPYRHDMNVIHISTNQELRVILGEISKILGPPYESTSAP